QQTRPRRPVCARSRGDQEDPDCLAAAYQVGNTSRQTNKRQLVLLSRRLSSVVCRLSSVVCRLSSVVCRLSSPLVQSNQQTRLEPPDIRRRLPDGVKAPERIRRARI